MKFKLCLVAEATFEVNPDNYKSHKALPDLSAQEMLDIDIDNVIADPMTFIDGVVDEAEQDNPNYKFEVTGEVVEE